MRHPYERLFWYLRYTKHWSWKTDDDGAIHNYHLPLFTAVAVQAYDFDGTYAAEGFLRGLCGMTEEQAAHAVLAADGCAYPGCGYEDLARKLRHYLGAI